MSALFKKDEKKFRKFKKFEIFKNFIYFYCLPQSLQPLGTQQRRNVLLVVFQFHSFDFQQMTFPKNEERSAVQRSHLSLKKNQKKIKIQIYFEISGLEEKNEEKVKQFKN